MWKKTNQRNIEAVSFCFAGWKDALLGLFVPIFCTIYKFSIEIGLPGIRMYLLIYFSTFSALVWGYELVASILFCDCRTKVSNLIFQQHFRDF